jgi:hypothetical protein
MTTPDDTSEPRGASAGTTRTPPPRSRRGAPATRPTFDDLDALNDLLLPEQQAALADPEPAPVTRDSRGNTFGGTKSATGKRGAPRPAPVEREPETYAGAEPEGRESTSGLLWETPEERDAREATPVRSTTSNRTAAVATSAAATEVYGDPIEPEVAPEPSPAATPRPVKPKAAKRPERRFRQTIQRVDLWSVTKMALCFYVSAMGVVVVSLVALWVVADSAGIIDNVENFIGDLFSSEDFQFVSGQVLRGAVLVGVVLVALLVAFTIIAASFYNIFAELFGGVEIVIREEEQPPKR